MQLLPTTLHHCNHHCSASTNVGNGSAVATKDSSSFSSATHFSTSCKSQHCPPSAATYHQYGVFIATRTCKVLVFIIFVCLACLLLNLMHFSKVLRNDGTLNIQFESTEQTDQASSSTTLSVEQQLVNSALCNPHAIDVVYTWVNSNDEQWQERYQRKFFHEHERLYQIANAAEASSIEHATESFRFRDFEQLRFSIRSVRKYAPWVRNIYIVTDKQVPHWLNTTSAALDPHRITIVDHRDIFPQESIQHLSVFNSYAIELNLHRIKGLSECFLYVQDDQIFINPVDMDLLYYNHTANEMKYHVVKDQIVNERHHKNPWLNTWVYTHDAFCNTMNLSFTQCNDIKWRFSSHMPQMYKKQWVKELEKYYFAQEFMETRSHAFRTERDLSITMVLYNHYMLYRYEQHVLKQQHKPVQLQFSSSVLNDKYHYTVTLLDNSEHYFHITHISDIIHTTQINLETIREVQQKNTVAVCLQDSTNNFNQVINEKVRLYHELLFPHIPEYELSV